MPFHKHILNILFQFISLFGTPIFYMPAIIYLFKIDSNFAAKLIFIIIFNEIICGAIKYIYPKERPVPMQNKNFIQKYYAGSFPSIHTARISAVLISLTPLYKNKIFILMAVLMVIGVGYSRIYLKKHYFIDVIAGFLIGAFMGLLGLMRG